MADKKKNLRVEIFNLEDLAVLEDEIDEEKLKTKSNIATLRDTKLLFPTPDYPTKWSFGDSSVHVMCWQLDYATARVRCCSGAAEVAVLPRIVFPGRLDDSTGFFLFG